MKILSIETSCDETAIAIVEASGALSTSVFAVLGSALHSQIETHAEYGGVFPMMAKREHTKNIIPILHSALENSKKGGLMFEDKVAELDDATKKQILTLLARENDLGELFLKFLSEHRIPNIDAIAVTSGPGLEPALWVGISIAKALALAWNTPLIPINHMEGHITSVLLSKNTNDNSTGTQDLSVAVEFPAIALLISGGHTEIVQVTDWHSYKILGSTLDDAVGEAFDKVARILGLPYPGGPEISKLADEDRIARPTIGKERSIILPRPMLASPNLDFSFSGLKTAVLYMVRDLKDPEKNGGKAIEDIDHVTKTQIAREFEDAATEVLVAKTRKALEDTSAHTLILGGGVTANKNIRKAFETLAADLGIPLLVPSIDLSTDNAVMIGIAALLRMKNEKISTKINNDFSGIKAEGNLSLE